jgi:hypothetical protein
MYMGLYSEEKNMGRARRDSGSGKLGKEGNYPFMGHGVRRKPAFPA